MRCIWPDWRGVAEATSRTASSPATFGRDQRLQPAAVGTVTPGGISVPATGDDGFGSAGDDRSGDDRAGERSRRRAELETRALADVHVDVDERENNAVQRVVVHAP